MAIVEQKKLRALPSCPVETTAVLVGNKWSILILRELMLGTKRFGELQRGVGSISQKVLTSHLRALEDHGIVVRTAYAEIPPRVEYTLTDIGRALQPVLDAMGDWGNRYKQMLLGR